MRWVALALLLGGCVDARSNAGAECARNSQCAAPLVCALERCRNECNQPRDCPVGSSCVRSAEGFGVCLLQDESSCASDDECAGALVCALDRCTSSCEGGCTPGTECRDGACFDPSVDASCSGDADCAQGVCIGGSCRLQCRSDRDCRFGATCGAGRCGDTALTDGAMPDTPGIDGGVVDPFCPPRTTLVVDVCTAGPRAQQHACAVLSDGRVVCWGDNAGLALGSADLPNSSIFGPAVVDGIDDATRVACAPWGGCAVHRDGGMSCWGANFVGQTGTGLPTNTIVTPVRVPTLTNVVDVSLRNAGGCAIDGTQVYCWGSNDVGELGTSGPAVNAPIVASDLPAASAISVSNGPFPGQAHGYVITTEGELVGFGGNPFTQPVDLTIAGGDLVDVATGEKHVCVLRSTGEVLCAGDNLFGQMGVADATGQEFVTVAGLAGVTALRGHSNANCVVTPTEGLCWGENTFGGLGVGTSGNQTTPAAVTLPGVGAPTVLEAGHKFGCALYEGILYCFGFNANAALGLGPDAPNTVEPTSPVICMP